MCILRLGMAPSYNPSTQEAEAGGSGDQPRLHSETISQKTKGRENDLKMYIFKTKKVLLKDLFFSFSTLF
jgi:hypothetical protein